MRRTGGGNDALLGQVCAQRVDRLRALTNQKVPGPVGHRRRLLRLANLLDDAAEHLDPAQRAQMDEAIASMETALALPGGANRRVAG